MSTYRIERAADTKAAKLYVGDETGALYIKHLNYGFVCIVPGKGSVQSGDNECGGGFTPVSVGSKITIEV